MLQKIHNAPGHISHVFLSSSSWWNQCFILLFRFKRLWQSSLFFLSWADSMQKLFKIHEWFCLYKEQECSWGKKTKRRGFQHSSLTIGYWCKICTQLTWNKTQKRLLSRLPPQKEVCLAYCIQTTCILPLVQADVAKAYSCFTVSLQSHKLPTIIKDLPQSGNLEVCGFCGQTPLLQTSVIFSHQKACRWGKSDSVGHSS